MPRRTAPETPPSTDTPPAADASPAAVQTPPISSPPATGWIETTMIPLASLVPSPTNPRKHFRADKQAELEASMRACGFSLSTLLVRQIQETLRVEPCAGFWILVRENGTPDGEPLTHHSTQEDAAEAMKARQNLFEVVAGERRLRAAQAVGIEQAPCIIRVMTDEEVLRFQLIENIQRDDLTAMEEAFGFRRLLALRDTAGKPVHSVATLHKATGKSERHIERMVKLCLVAEDSKLTEFATALEVGTVSPKHAILVTRIVDPKARAQFAGEILHPRSQVEPLSVRQAELVLQRDYMADTRNSHVDPDDPNIVPVEVDPETGERLRGGACTDCPFLLKNCANAFEGGIPSGQQLMCMNPGCFTAKKTIAWKLWQEKETKPGRRALSETECRQIYRNGDQLDWNANYVDLAQHPDSNDLKPGQESPGNWRKLIKGKELEVFVVRDRNNRTHELVRQDLAITAAVENGHKVFRKEAVAAAQEELELESEAPSKPASEMTEEERAAVAKRIEEAKKQQAKEHRKQRFEGRVANRLPLALGEALAGKANKPPGGFWGYLAGNSDAYLEDGLSFVYERRKWSDDTDWGAEVKKMSETQQFGFFLELFYHSHHYSSGAAQELLKLFGVNAAEIEKQVRAVVKSEFDAEDVQRELVAAITWEGEQWLAISDSEHFKWNEHNVCTNPSVATIDLGNKKCSVEIAVGRSKKGWHYGNTFDSKLPNQIRGNSGPVSQSNVGYNNPTLALKTGLKGALIFFKEQKAPAAVLDRIKALVDMLDKEAPDEVPSADKKPAKKGGKK